MDDKKERVKRAINWQLGVEQFGGDEEMFTMMVENFEGLTMDQELRKLSESLRQKDWKDVKLHAYILKGSSSYLAATGIQEVSWQIQLKCETFLKQIEKDILSRSEKENFENDIVALCLVLLNEAKYLKERISEVVHKPCVLTEIETYEKIIYSQYRQYDRTPTTTTANCSSCNIF